jgi:hypothetical protein
MLRYTHLVGLVITETENEQIKHLGHFNPTHDRYKMPRALLIDQPPFGANLELPLTH